MTRRMHRTLLAALLSSGLALALPENGQVIQGNVQIVQPQNHILQILQSSPTGIINWGSFNIDANQLVQFLQPGASSALLNRVIGQDPSQILGQIQANGRIFLVNPNGILFGPGSSVNAGSFMATTLSIQDQDFIQGRYNFQQDPNSPLRAVVNQGEIRVTDGGFIALVSPLVDNQGLLVAQQGQVVLGATTQATLQVDARGLLQVSIPDGFQSHSQASAATPQTVLLTQGQMSDTLAQLVRGGHPEGERIIETSQGIQLVGAEGLLVNQGTVQVDALQGPAGNVLMDSSQATVNTGSSLTSASSVVGDGGDIRVLSRGAAVQMGQLAVRSESAGNGGFIEVSGRTVQLTQAPDLAASQGQPGQLLIDPDIVHIVASGGDNPTFPVLGGDAPTNQSINAAALDTAGAVRVEAQQDLFIDPGVAIVLTQLTELTIEAINGNLNMEAGSSISASNPATTVTLLAGNTATVHSLQVPTSNVHGGTAVEIRAGSIGQPTSDTTLNVTSNGEIRIFDQIDVAALNHARVSQTATGGRVLFFPGAKFNVAANTANVSLDGNDGVVFFEDASLQASSAANVSLASAAGDVNFQDRSGLNLAGPATINITTPAGGFIANTGASINATNPASVLNVQGDNQNNFGSNLAVPTQNLQLNGTLALTNTTVGVPTSATVLNATAGTTLLSGLTIQGTSADIDLDSSGPFSLSDNSQMHIQPASASVNITSLGSLLLATNSSLRADGAATIALTSTNGDVFLSRDSRLDLAGPSTVTINSPVGQTTLFEGATINATNPASSVNISAGQQLEVGGNLFVPTLDLHSDSLVRMFSGTLGTPGSPTSLNITAGGLPDGIAVFAGSNLDIQGTTADITLTSAADLFIGQDSSVRILAPTANLVVDAQRAGGNAVFFGVNSTLSATGGANITLNANDGNLLLREGSLISVAGPGDLRLAAPAGRVNMSDGASLSGNQQARLTARDGMDIGNLRVPTNHLTSTTGTITFQNSTIGRPEANTVLNVSSPDIAFGADRTTNVVGTQIQVDLEAGGNVLGLPGSQLNLTSSQSNVNVTAPQLLVLNTVTSSGAGNFSITGGSTRVDTLLSAPGPASRAELTASSLDLTVAGLQLGNVTLNAARSVVFTGGTIGRPGEPTRLTGTATADAVIINDLLLQGSQVDFQLTASHDIVLANEKSVTLEGANNLVRWDAANLNLWGAGSSLSATGATRLILLAGTNLIQNAGTSVSLPDAASEIELQSNGTMLLNRVTTGGNLSATVSAGNVRLTDQLAANNLTLNVSGELIAQPGSRQPALIGTSALNVTAGRISGTIDDPSNGLVKGLAFATGPNAQVRLDVTGTNNVDTGNRAANLLYNFPQSGNLVLLHPTGDVLLVNEPAPPTPEEPAPPAAQQPPQQSGLAREVVEQSNQSLSILTHPFSPPSTTSTQNLVYLTYNNPGLTQDSVVSPNSALLEGCISPLVGSETPAQRTELEQSIQAPELTATQQAIREDAGVSISSRETYSDWQSLLSGSTVEVVVLLPERSANEVRQRDSEERERATSVLVVGDDEDSDTLFWRKLIEGIILWEE